MKDMKYYISVCVCYAFCKEVELKMEAFVSFPQNNGNIFCHSGKPG